VADYDETLAFIASIDDAVTGEEVCRRLLNLSGRFGLTGVIAGTMPGSGTPPSDQQRHILLDGWPDGWIDRYVQRDYVNIDPVIERIRKDRSPFMWDEAPIAPTLRTRAATMNGEAREFGLAGGMAVPLVTLEGKIASVSFGGHHIELSPDDRSMLALVSVYAIGRAFRLSQPTPPVPICLSPRETEAIRWAAIGKTDWEISMIMAISEHTAARHLANAKRKLGAANRAHAVAEAIRAGIVR
jgi:LuxR family quorum sensing-dependent transcriptional regulator